MSPRNTNMSKEGKSEEKTPGNAFVTRLSGGSLNAYYCLVMRRKVKGMTLRESAWVSLLRHAVCVKA
jgi:hypothetical protein